MTAGDIEDQDGRQRRCGAAGLTGALASGISMVLAGLAVETSPAAAGMAAMAVRDRASTASPWPARAAARG